MTRFPSRFARALMLVQLLVVAAGACKPNNAKRQSVGQAQREQTSGLSLLSATAYSGFLPVRRAFKLDASKLDRSNLGVDAAIGLVNMRQYAWITCEQRDNKLGFDWYTEAEVAAMLGDLMLTPEGELTVHNNKTSCHVIGPRLIPFPVVEDAMARLETGATLSREDFTFIQAFLLTLRGVTLAGPLTGSTSAWLAGQVKMGYRDGKVFKMDDFMARIKKLDPAINPCINAKTALEKKTESWKLANYQCVRGTLAGTYAPGGRNGARLAKMSDEIQTAIGGLFDDIYASRIDGTTDPYVKLFDLLTNTRGFDKIAANAPTAALARLGLDAQGAVEFNKTFASAVYGARDVSTSSSGLALSDPRQNSQQRAYPAPTGSRPGGGTSGRGAGTTGPQPAPSGARGPSGGIPAPPRSAPILNNANGNNTSGSQPIVDGQIPASIANSDRWRGVLGNRSNGNVIGAGAGSTPSSSGNALERVTGNRPGGASNATTGDVVAPGNYVPSFANNNWIQSVDRNDPSHSVFTYPDGRSESWRVRVEGANQIWTPDAARPMTDPNNPNGPPIGLTERINSTNGARTFDINLSSGIERDTRNITGSFAGVTDPQTGHDRIQNDQDRTRLQQAVQEQFCRQEERLRAIAANMTLAQGDDLTKLTREREDIVTQQGRNIQATAIALNVPPAQLRATLVAGCRGRSAVGGNSDATTRATPPARSLRLLDDGDEECAASSEDEGESTTSSGDDGSNAAADGEVTGNGTSNESSGNGAVGESPATPSETESSHVNEHTTEPVAPVAPVEQDESWPTTPAKSEEETTE